MSIIINPNPMVVEPTPNPMVGLPGSKLVSMVAYPPYFSLHEGDTVHTTRIDFVSPTIIDRDALRQAMESILGNLIAGGEQGLAYALYRGAEVDITVPPRICFGQFCWDVPISGTVPVMIKYRLWVLTRDRIGSAGGSADARAAIPVVAAIVLVLSVILLIAIIAGVIEMARGDITWHDIAKFTTDLAKAPGENVSGALTGPLIAFALALVAAGIFLPLAQGNIQARIPIGPAQITAGASGGGRR